MTAVRSVAPLAPWQVLDPGTGRVRAAAHLPAEPDTVLWGRLPCAADHPVLRVDPGTEVTIDQGRDPRACFGRHGEDRVLADAITIAASDVPRTPGVDGPHVVSRTVAVSGARPGDLTAATVLETLPRVPVPTGLDEDLDEAVRDCVRQAVALLGARDGMDPRHALAHLSAATDLEISQVVDVVEGVHARIRRSDFEGGHR